MNGPRATYAMPGVGGSLGKCAVCGDTFLYEIMFAKSVQTVHVDGISKSLPVHDECLKVLEENGPDWKTLPQGPLREAFEQSTKETTTDD